MSKQAPTAHEVFLASGTSVEEQFALERQLSDRVALTNGAQKATYPNSTKSMNLSSRTS